jgi:UDPglucose 6-dehydrogenase
MREAPSRVLIQALLERGASVAAHDPVAMEEAGRVLALDLKDHPERLSRLTYAATPEAALDGAQALIIVTEWKAFRSPDFEVIKAKLADPLIIDGRNLYDPETVKFHGLRYLPIGRPGVA